MDNLQEAAVWDLYAPGVSKTIVAKLGSIDHAIHWNSGLILTEGTIPVTTAMEMPFRD